jgi:hypothetical protein
MPGYGRRGKPKAGFPLRPQPLEIAKAAISTFPPARRRSPWKSGNPKAGFPLSHRLGSFSKPTKEAWQPAADAPGSRLMLRENQIRFSGSSLDENMLT